MFFDILIYILKCILQPSRGAKEKKKEKRRGG
jgi:hypothetical protein